jgi:hypothetical protein
VALYGFFLKSGEKETVNNIDDFIREATHGGTGKSGLYIAGVHQQKDEY